MAYTIIDSSGVVTYDGDGTTQIQGPFSMSGTMQMSGTMVFGNTPKLVPATMATSKTVLAGGLYVLSSSSGAVTATVPDPSTVPGSRFIFRCGSAHAHLVTSSLAPAGFKSFAHVQSTTGVFQGSLATLLATEGSSMILDSDGYHYLVSAASGTVVLSQL